MCGSKTTSQQNQAQTFSPPPEVLQNYQAVTGKAQGIAATPYSAYGGEFVAPINQQQGTGIAAVNAASGIQNPYNTTAGGLASSSAGAINPSAVDASAIQQYESPYQSDVINATEAQIQNQNQQQAAALRGNAISSGSFGGDRAGIAQAALANQQDLAANQTIAGLENQNYAQALGEANVQQGVGLGAAQNTAARQIAASQQLGILGQNAQGEALQEANAQANAGTLQQTTQQAQDTAAYNQFLQQQAYPFETTGWLANIVEGIGSQSGGTSTGQTTQQGSAGSQIAGGLLGLASFLHRGGRVPHRASGGGLASGIYIPQVFDPTAPGQSGGIVPNVQLPVGHTMPSAGLAAMPAGQTPAQQGQSMAQTGQAVQKLGSAAKGLVNNPSFGGGNFLTGDAYGGSSANPLDGLSAEDYGAGFRRGGIVPRHHYDHGGIVARRHYDDGGAIEDPTFANMLGAESNGQQFAPDGSVLTSRKGAQGIAQIMPATGPEAAGYAGLAYDPQKLASDPAYNEALGKAYFQHQIETFGSPDKAAAAYNAGPARVQKALGLAAANGGDYLDYLPAETRAYVAKVAGADADSDAPPGLGAALAFDNGPNDPNAPAAQAINRGIAAGAAPSQGGIAGAPQVSAPQFPDNSQTPDSGKTGILGLNLSPETRQLMLSAGLGIMGGTSRSALTNIGQGGLTGIQAATQMRNTASEIGLRNAQAGAIPSEIGLRGAQTQSVQTETALKQQQLKLMLRALDQNEKILGGAPSASAGPSVTSPNASAPTAGVSAAQAAAPPKQIAPQYDPVRLRAAAENMSFVNPQAAANYRAQAQAIESGQSMVQFSDGTWGKMPGFNEAAAATAAAKTQAQKQAEAPFDLQEVQDTPGGPTRYVPKSQILGQSGTPVGIGAGSPPDGAANAAATANPSIAKQPAFIAERQSQIAKNENDMVGQMQARQLARQRLQTIAKIMQTFQPGAFAQQKAAIVANLRSVGIPVPDYATMNPAAFQEFTKNAVGNVFNDVKAMGGRVLVSEIEGLTRANANPELQPAAAAAIVGQGIGLLNYEDQHTRDYFDWKHQNPNAFDTSSFELPWLKDHPVGQFVGEATKGIAYRGQDIPAPQQRTIGQTYMTPKGPAVWRGQGWQLMSQGAAP